MIRKGIVLAGGTGSRMYPLAAGVSKQLMPVYDKPLIYYPLSILLLADIRDILIITTPQDQASFKRLLKNGIQLGVNIDYAVQPNPDGIAQAFLIAESFLQGEGALLVLGDNVFFGHGLPKILTKAAQDDSGATVFAYYVENPQDYGVLDIDSSGKVRAIEEKPLLPKSHYAVTGLYFYDNLVVEYAKSLTPSQRGELEITDLNNLYLKENSLRAEILGRGFAWLDTGTHDSLLEASMFVKAVQQRQGLQIACLEEIALQKGYISKEELSRLAGPIQHTKYGKYLLSLLEPRMVLNYE